ncbi:MAG: GerAB/ArcD/ProY family transporter [Bacillota bacterium]
MRTGARYFSWRELTALIVANKLSMLTTYAPILTGAPATRDAWLSAWLAAGIALVFALIPFHLLLRFPGHTLFTINMKVLGGWAGRLLNLAYAGLFLYLAAVSTRMFTEVFLVAMLPETPSFAINLLMTLLVVTGVLGGMEVLARLADMVTPVILVTILLLVMIGSTLMELDRLLPLFEFGVGPMLHQTLTPIGIFGEISWTVALGMPFLRQPRDALKAIGAATLINGLFVSLGAAMLIAMMGPELIDRELFPTLTAIRMIRLAEFLTRIEWLLATLWVGSIYVKLGLLIWGAARALRESLGLTHRRLTVLAVASVGAVWSHYLFADTAEMMAYFLPENNLLLSLTPALLLPLLTLAVALVRGLRESPPAGGADHG